MPNRVCTLPSTKSGCSVSKKCDDRFQSSLYAEIEPQTKKLRACGFQSTSGDQTTAEVVGDDVDLLDVLDAPWPVRNQMFRGTCTGFCTSAAVELLEAQTTRQIREFSPEYMYHYLRDAALILGPDEVPDLDIGAAKLTSAPGVLKTNGICLESTMPYDPDLPVPETRQPHPQAHAEAQNHLHEGACMGDFGSDFSDLPHDARIPEHIHAELLARRPVTVGLPIFKTLRDGANNWDNSFTLSRGIVHSPDERPHVVSMERVSGHAVCIVGFQKAPAHRGGGWFIFRNSWGEDFCTNPGSGGSGYPRIPGKGYGAISADHLRRYTIEFASFRQLADAPSADMMV